MAKKILFMIPPVAEKIWSNYYPEMYLGLAYIAGLAKAKGHLVKVIDLDVGRMSDLSLLKSVHEYAPDIVAMTALYGSIGNAMRIASVLKRVIPSRIVLGGLPATFATERLLKTGHFDILVRGEGELTFLDILSDKPLRSIEGISFIRDGKITHNPARRFINDLDKLGLPLREIFPLRRYKIRFQMHNSTSIETCRGCPYGCEFCTQKPKEGGMLRFRSADMVKSELQSISRFKFIRRIMIVDNDFLVHRRHSEEILKLICKEGFNLRFNFMFATRVDNIMRGGDALLALIQKSNVNTIFFGLESLSDSRRQKIGKIKDLRKTGRLFRSLEQKGIDPLPSYIIGFPEETRRDINRTLEAAKELNTRLFSFNILTPYPGTSFFESCVRDALIVDEDLQNYDNAHIVFRHSLDIQKEFYRMHQNYIYRFKYIFSSNFRYFYRKPIYGRVFYLIYFTVFVWAASLLRRFRG